MVEGAGHPVLKRRRVVILAEPRSGIAIVLKDPAHGRVLRPDDRIVARKTCCELGNDPKPTEWWLRPVISAARVGEHSAVE
jgi:hypothetical protein